MSILSNQNNIFLPDVLRRHRSERACSSDVLKTGWRQCRLTTPGVSERHFPVSRASENHVTVPETSGNYLYIYILYIYIYIYICVCVVRYMHIHKYILSYV